MYADTVTQAVEEGEGVVTAWGAADMQPTVTKYVPPPPLPLPSPPPSPAKQVNSARAAAAPAAKAPSTSSDSDDNAPLPDFDGEDWEMMTAKKPKRQKSKPSPKKQQPASQKDTQQREAAPETAEGMTPEETNGDASMEALLFPQFLNTADEAAEDSGGGGRGGRGGGRGSRGGRGGGRGARGRGRGGRSGQVSVTFRRPTFSTIELRPGATQRECMGDAIRTKGMAEESWSGAAGVDGGRRRRR
jgi:hypothetical protein